MLQVRFCPSPITSPSSKRFDGTTLYLIVADHNVGVLVVFVTSATLYITMVDHEHKDRASHSPLLQITIVGTYKDRASYNFETIDYVKQRAESTPMLRRSQSLCARGGKMSLRLPTTTYASLPARTDRQIVVGCTPHAAAYFLMGSAAAECCGGEGV